MSLQSIGSPGPGIAAHVLLLLGSQRDRGTPPTSSLDTATAFCLFSESQDRPASGQWLEASVFWMHFVAGPA